MGPGFAQALRSPVLLGALAVLATLPLWMPGYYLNIVALALVYAALASAWNIVGGLTGQISLAHSLFVGTGAMVASALLLSAGVNLWLGMLIAAALSGVLGALIAFLDFRFRLGHLSFALVTLAFAEMGEIVVTGTDVLGGASGLFLPKDTGRLEAFQFGGSAGNFWAILVAAAICVGANLVIVNAPLGYYLRAIRDNEDAAQGLGVGLLRNKVVAMTISAVLTSCVGTLYARYLTFADPYLLASPVLTIEIVLFATIGGLGSPFGPAVGALILVPLGEILRGQLGGVLPGLHYFLYGLVVVLVVLLLPGGIAPALARLFRSRRPADAISSKPAGALMPDGAGAPPGVPTPAERRPA